MTYTPAEIGDHFVAASEAWRVFESDEFMTEALAWSVWHREVTGTRNYFDEARSEPVGIDHKAQQIVFSGWDASDYVGVPFAWFTMKDNYKVYVKGLVEEAAQKKAAAEAEKQAAEEKEAYQTYLDLKERFEGDQP